MAKALSYHQRLCLQKAAVVPGWTVGNTNRTADALLRLGLIEVDGYGNSESLVIYSATSRGYATLNCVGGTAVDISQIPLTEITP